MNKKFYVIAGVVALTMTGSAYAQDHGPDRGRMSMDRGMSMMDTDKNGTVEKSEFEAMIAKRFAETDSDGNGITFAEYSAKSASDRAARDEKRSERKAARDKKMAENAERHAERSAERLKKRFDNMDENSDGTVSAEEYNASGAKMFDRMDRNDDGILNDRRSRGKRGGRDHKPDQT